MRKWFWKAGAAAALLLSMAFPAYGAEGWVSEGDDWYYYRDGKMLVNEWYADDTGRYYLGADGKMYVGVHIIDGYYYEFNRQGRVLALEGGGLYHDNIYISFDGTGRGTARPITPEEAVIYSRTSDWIYQTFKIYTESQDDLETIARIQRAKIPTSEELLNRDWGITTLEEGTSTINNLIEQANASQDKSEKAWNYCRAMILYRHMFGCDWITLREQVDHQYDIALLIQQSFDSWDDYLDQYMTGYRRWAGSAGESQTAQEYREKAYNHIKSLVHFEDEHWEHWIPWNEKLEKLW